MSQLPKEADNKFCAADEDHRFLNVPIANAQMENS